MARAAEARHAARNNGERVILGTWRETSERAILLRQNFFTVSRAERKDHAHCPRESRISVKPGSLGHPRRAGHRRKWSTRCVDRVFSRVLRARLSREGQECPAAGSRVSRAG